MSDHGMLERTDPLELKAVSESARTIEGYASVFDVLDAVNDRVLPGAFDRTIREKRLSEIGVFINHKTDRLPIGVPLEIREDAYGLHTTARIYRTQAGDDLLSQAKEMLAMGVGLGMSIGYKARGSEYRRDPDGLTFRALTDVDLHEFSYVPAHLAANRLAAVSGVKRVQTRDEMLAELDDIDRWIQESKRKELMDARMWRERALAELDALDDRPKFIKDEEEARRKVDKLWELVGKYGMEHYDACRKIAFD
jgi:HK97 family phage prohead protease